MTTSAPTTILRTVDKPRLRVIGEPIPTPRRPPNEQLRPREFLTAQEEPAIFALSRACIARGTGSSNPSPSIGESDGREAARALPPAACLARPADRARLCLSAIPHSQHPPASLSQRRSDLALGTSLATLTQRPVATASLERGYWNIAPQRYCPRLARCWRALGLAADRAGNAARKPGNPRGFFG